MKDYPITADVDAFLFTLARIVVRLQTEGEARPKPTRKDDADNLNIITLSRVSQQDAA